MSHHSLASSSSPASSPPASPVGCGSPGSAHRLCSARSVPRASLTSIDKLIRGDEPTDMSTTAAQAYRDFSGSPHATARRPPSGHAAAVEMGMRHRPESASRPFSTGSSAYSEDLRDPGPAARPAVPILTAKGSEVAGIVQGGPAEPMVTSYRETHRGFGADGRPAAPATPPASTVGHVMGWGPGRRSPDEERPRTPVERSSYTNLFRAYEHARPATAATRAKGSSIANLLMLGGKSIELRTVYGEAHKSFSGLATPASPTRPRSGSADWGDARSSLARPRNGHSDAACAGSPPARPRSGSIDRAVVGGAATRPRSRSGSVGKSVPGSPLANTREMDAHAIGGDALDLLRCI
eukprot:m51a1_g14382 hypothetical protein (352) ;mRNA; r:291879-292934